MYYKEKILVLHVGGDGAASASVMATIVDKFSKDAWGLKTLAGVSTARGVAWTKTNRPSYGAINSSSFNGSAASDLRVSDSAIKNESVVDSVFAQDVHQSSDSSGSARWRWPPWYSEICSASNRSTALRRNDKPRERSSVIKLDIKPLCLHAFKM